MENWKFVGKDTPFLNGWDNMAGDDPGLRFRKDDSGNVILKGIVNNGVGKEIFILPEDYRPNENIRISNTGIRLPYISDFLLPRQVGIKTTGEVLTNKNGDWLVINDLIFKLLL